MNGSQNEFVFNDAWKPEVRNAGPQSASARHQPVAGGGIARRRLRRIPEVALLADDNAER